MGKGRYSIPASEGFKKGEIMTEEQKVLYDKLIIDILGLRDYEYEAGRVPIWVSELAEKLIWDGWVKK